MVRVILAATVTALLAATTAAVAGPPPDPADRTAVSAAPVVQLSIDPQSVVLRRLLDDLVAGGAFAQAVQPASDLYEFHLGDVGPAHHRTVTARVELAGIEQMAALSTDAQEELAGAERLRRSAIEEYQINRWPSAQEKLTEVIRVFESHLGSDHPKLIGPLTTSASILQGSGDADEAGDRFRRALDISLEHYGANHPIYAAAQTYLASHELAANRPLEALERAQQAWAITSRQLGESHPNNVVVLTYLANAYEAIGQYDEAIEAAASLVTIRTRTFGDKNIMTARAHATLGRLLAAAGEPDQAELGLRKALQIYTSQPRAVGLQLAILLDNLGALSLNLGRYDEAIALLKRAYDVRRRAVGETHSSIVTPLRRLADALVRAGAVAEAELVLQRAALAARNIYGPDHEESLATLSDLAALFVRQGRYAEAAVLNRKRLQIATTSLGLRHPSARAAHSALADVLPETPMPQAGVAAFLEEMLSVRRTTETMESVGVVEVLSRLAQYSHRIGDTQSARRWAQTLLALTEKMMGKQDRRLAVPLLHLAEAFDGQGLGDQAVESIDRAIALLDATAETGDAKWVAALTAGARFHHLRGHHDQAIELVSRVRESLAASPSFVDSLPSRSPEHLLASHPYLIAAAIMMDTGRHEDAVICLDQHWTRGWLETLSDAGLSPADALDDPQRRAIYRTRARIAALDAQRHRLERFGQSTDSVEQTLASAQKALEQLQTKASADPRYAAVSSPMPIDLSRLQAEILSDGATAVVGWFDRPSLGLGDSDSTRFAFVLRKDQPVRWISLPDDVASVVSPGNPADDDDGDTESADETLAEAGDLFHERFEPILEALTGIRRLIIVPTGTPMVHVPVEALRITASQLEGEDAFLVDRFEITYAPSLSSLMERPRLAGGSTASGRPNRLLAMVGRTINPALARRSGSVPPAHLTAVAREAAGLAGLFSDSQVWRSENASEKRLWLADTDRTLAGVGVLHFGTPSYIDGLWPHRSAIALSRSSTSVAVQDLLSEDRFNDGWLDLREILHLTIGADLVALTACNALGTDDQPTTNALPLAHAFLLAGADQVLTTLWPVEGEARALLICRFYKNRQQAGTSTAGALRAAKQWIRSLHGQDLIDARKQIRPTDPSPEIAIPVPSGETPPFAHPHYWAGYVLVTRGPIEPGR